ncbi:MAG: hypothetical protein AAGD92_15030 [Pseudomonadota bacterium]
MGMASKYRSLLLAGSAIALLAACTDAEISSPGEAGFGGTPPSGGGGDGGGGGDAGGSATDRTPVGGCPTGTSASIIPGSDIMACEVFVDVNGAITSDVTLVGGQSVSAASAKTALAEGPVYFFSGATNVGTDDGATPGELGGTTVTLMIDPGVTLAFADENAFLSVQRGSRLVANGTPDAPIAMTSEEDIIDDGVANDSQGAARGQWGGLIINGRAPINSCADPSVPAECETAGEGGTGVYGGDNPNDNSGVLNYVRVQYAGFQITDGNELNGIAFQGVGDGTEVDFIQVHNNDDDGVEFFGGTVDVRHVVLTGVDDDALDWVAGWNGSAQDVVVIGSGVGDNGFEGDNNENAQDVDPRSNPTITNYTLVGDPNEDIGMLIREGTAGTFVNGVVTGWGDACLDIDDDASIALINGSPDLNANTVEDLQISSVFFSCETSFVSDDDTPVDGGTFAGISSGSSTLSGVLPGTNEAAVEAVDPTVADTVVEFEDFIGAFEPGLDSSQTWAFGWTVPNSVFPDSVCPDGTTDITDSATVPAPANGRVCQLPTIVLEDTELFAGNLYQLNGNTVVGQDAGPDVDNPNPAASVTLTVNAGVTIFGQDEQDFLVVNRGSQLVANGTSGAPIIFTSDEDLLGENVVGDERGQWGGLIINGRAPINSCADPTEPASCETAGEGGTGLYGGNDPDDNSGVLNFVRVQFAGFQITDGNELNGIAFQGVGRGTEVDFIQVHNNDDDGVEFFGGTVNASHLVITGVDDDALDWVAGWNGSAQFVLIAGDGAGDNGFEGDNNENAQDVDPRSNPTISNFTLIGDPNEDIGMLIREGSAGTFINGVVDGWADACVDIDDDASIALIDSSATPNAPSVEDLQISAVFYSCDTPFVDDDDTPVDGSTFDGDVVGTSTLTTPAGFSTAFVNGANENAVTAIDPSAIPGTDNLDLVPVDVIGALGESDDDEWYVGWTLPGSF